MWDANDCCSAWRMLPVSYEQEQKMATVLDSKSESLLLCTLLSKDVQGLSVDGSTAYYCIKYVMSVQ